MVDDHLLYHSGKERNVDLVDNIHPPDPQDPEFWEEIERTSGSQIPDYAPIDYWEMDDGRAGVPSLPVILFSAACGVGGGIIGLYVSLQMFQWTIVFSAAAATLSLLFSLGISGAILSSLTGSRAAPSNILFSCGLVVFSLLFLAMCSVFGAIVATFILTW